MINLLASQGVQEIKRLYLNMLTMRAIKITRLKRVSKHQGSCLNLRSLRVLPGRKSWRRVGCGSHTGITRVVECRVVVGLKMWRLNIPRNHAACGWYAFDIGHHTFYDILCAFWQLKWKEISFIKSYIETSNTWVPHYTSTPLLSRVLTVLYDTRSCTLLLPRFMFQFFLNHH